jgi:hypothetical protein
MDVYLKQVNDVLWSPYFWMIVSLVSLLYAYWVTQKVLIEPFQAAMGDFESAPNMCPHILNTYLTSQKALEVFKEKDETNNIKTYEGILAAYKQKLKDLDCINHVSEDDKPKVPTD